MYAANERYAERYMTAKNRRFYRHGLQQRRVRAFKKRLTLLFTFVSVILALLVLSGFSSAQAAFHSAGTVSTSAAAEETAFYEIATVRHNDTLWTIAQRYYTSEAGTIQSYIREIKELNQMTGDRIYAGQHICVPCYAA